MLLAAYTRQQDGEIKGWLGGQDAYVATVQKTIRRVTYALDNIQRDPIFVGHISDRFVRVVPWAVDGLNRYSDRVMATRIRLNYYTCAVLSSAGEMMISLDDPLIYAQCDAGGMRNPECKAELTTQLAAYTTHGHRFADVCPWSNPSIENSPP